MNNSWVISGFGLISTPSFGAYFNLYDRVLSFSVRILRVNIASRPSAQTLFLFIRVHSRLDFSFLRSFAAIRVS